MYRIWAQWHICTCSAVGDWEWQCGSRKNGQKEGGSSYFRLPAQAQINTMNRTSAGILFFKIKSQRWLCIKIRSLKRPLPNLCYTAHVARTCKHSTLWWSAFSLFYVRSSTVQYRTQGEEAVLGICRYACPAKEALSQWPCTCRTIQLIRFALYCNCLPQKQLLYMDQLVSILLNRNSS